MYFKKMTVVLSQVLIINKKNLLFQGPYKQFKGRGKMTGPITIVLYEDPQDGVPKIHIR